MCAFCRRDCWYGLSPCSAAALASKAKGEQPPPERKKKKESRLGWLAKKTGLSTLTAWFERFEPCFLSGRDT